MFKKVFLVIGCVGLLVSGYFVLSLQIAEANHKEVYVGLVVVIGVPYWQQVREGMEAAGKELGVEIRWMGPVDTDVAKQTADMDTLVAQGVDGIAIATADPEGITPAINRAIEAGIPVVTFGNDAPQSKRLAYFGTDNYTSSYQGGHYLAKLLGGKGKVGVSIGYVGVPDQERRLTGYQDALKEYPDIEIVSMVEDHYDYAVGLREVKSMLAAHPDIDAIVGLNATSGAVIAGALREEGYKPGEVMVTAFDRNEDVLNLIKEGWIQASIVQKSFLYAYLATRALYLYNHGFLYPRSLEWQEAGINPFPEIVNTGSLIATKDNVDAFYLKK